MNHESHIGGEGGEPLSRTTLRTVGTVLALAAWLGLGGCSPSQGDQVTTTPTGSETDVGAAEGHPSEERSETAATPHSTNEFDPATIQVGDVVAGMTVTSVDFRNDGHTITASIEFHGQATVSGHFTHTGVDPDAGFTAAFHQVFISNLDEPSEARLPRMTGDPRSVNFALTNYEEVAKDAFGPEGAQGQATIVIDTYHIYFEPTEAFNAATLLKVIGTSTTSK